jgi:hypothetical protein
MRLADHVLYNQIITPYNIVVSVNSCMAVGQTGAIQLGPSVVIYEKEKP